MFSWARMQWWGTKYLIKCMQREKDSMNLQHPLLHLYIISELQNYSNYQNNFDVTADAFFSLGCSKQPGFLRAGWRWSYVRPGPLWWSASSTWWVFHFFFRPEVLLASVWKKHTAGYEKIQMIQLTHFLTFNSVKQADFLKYCIRRLKSNAGNNNMSSWVR